MSLVLRGLRARAALTLATMGMALLAAAAAVVGPAYAQAASLSLLSGRLDGVPSSQLGLSWRLVPFGTHADPNSAVNDALSVARRANGASFSSAVASLTTYLFSARGGTSQFNTLLLWRADQCAHLRIQGSCPTRAGEVLMAAADARFYHVRTGDTVQMSVGDPVSVRVVGLYEQVRPESDYWYGTSLMRVTPTPPSRVSPHSAPLLAAQAQFAAIPAAKGQSRTGVVDELAPCGGAGQHPTRTFHGTYRCSAQWYAGADRPLDTVGITLADVAASSAVAASRSNADINVRLPSGTVNLSSTDNQLATIASTVAGEQSLLTGLCTAATAPLVVLAILLLYLLVRAAADQRRPEMALAKLRGLHGGDLLRFGLAEPVTVTLLGCLTGALAGWLVLKLLAAAWLRPGTPTPFGGAMALAAAGVFGAGVLACAGAVASVVRERLRTQLVGTARPSAARRGVVVAQAMVVALAVATSYQVLQDRRHPSDGRLGQLAPLFLALATAVLGSFFMAFLAGRWLDATRAGAGSAGFLASRRLARRRDGVSLTAPVVAAVTLAVFAGCTWQVGQQWRLSQARMLVGADVAYVSTLDPWKTLAAVERADPHRRWLMTSLQELGTETQAFDNSYRRLFVDASRLARVSAWDPSWAAGSGPARVAARLVAGKSPPLEVTGTRLSVTLSSELLRSVPAYLDLKVRDATGTAHDVVLGPLPSGGSTLDSPMPYCSDSCQVEAIAVTDTGGLPIATRGSVTVSGLSADGTAVDAGLSDGLRWRAGRADSVGRSAVTALSPGPPGLRVSLDTRQNAAVAAVVPATEPAVAPLVVAGATRTGHAGSQAVVPGADGAAVPVRVVQRVDALPLLGTNGVLGDLSTFLSQANGTTFDAQVRVLARADTPDRVLEVLAGAGIATGHPDRLADRVRTLDEDPYAMGLQLYLAIAIASLLLAFAGVAAMVAVQTRWRSTEAAALRVVGVSPRAVVMSSVAEFAASMSVAVLLGLLAGVLALAIALPALPLGDRAEFAPATDFGLRWGVIGLTAAVALAGSMLVAYLLARIVVSRGRPQLLRQADG